MAEWLFEAGIGEARAALVDQDRILEARIEREGEGPRIGAALDARLVEPARVLLDAPGEPVATLAAAPRLPLGTRLRVEVVRMALRERGRDKPARVRVAAPDAVLGPGPDLRSRIVATGHGVVDLTPFGPDRLEAAGWSERIDHARTGHWPFPGGALWVDPTPAMLMIDIDGDGDGDAFALARAGGLAAIDLIRCCDIGGAIGIDFPTLRGRAERQAIDTLIDESLPQPFQRTAVNGFGFVQIVRRRERPSLVEQLQFDGVATDAALLLRQAERAVGTGPLQLTARPAVFDHIAAHPEWTAELGRRTGRVVDLRADAATKGTGHAQ